MNALAPVAAATALGSGVLAGVFFGFSTLVMPSLRRLPVPEGVTAMQAINDVAPRSLLMLPLVTSGAGSLAVAVWALADADTAGRGWLLAGAGAGVTCFLITAAYHVPRNNALATWVATAPGTTDLWQRYLREWTAMNHVRGLAGLASAAALSAGAARAWMG